MVGDAVPVRSFTISGRSCSPGDFAVGTYYHDLGRGCERGAARHARISFEFARENGIDISVGGFGKVFHLPVLVGVGFDDLVGPGIDDDHGISPPRKHLAPREDHTGLGSSGFGKQPERAGNIFHCDRICVQVNDTYSGMRFVVGGRILNIGLSGPTTTRCCGQHNVDLELAVAPVEVSISA